MELDVHVIHYLVISTIMMFCGIYGFFTRKNLLALLISVELMLNATNINFAVSESILDASAVFVTNGIRVCFFISPKRAALFFRKPKIRA